jgi:hypothetical protein
MGLGAKQIQILRSITTLRKDIDQIGYRVTDAKNRPKNLERDSGDETTDSAASSEKDEQQSHGGELAALKLGFDDLRKSFDVWKERLERSESIVALITNLIFGSGLNGRAPVIRRGTDPGHGIGQAASSLKNVPRVLFANWKVFGVFKPRPSLGTYC